MRRAGGLAAHGHQGVETGNGVQVAVIGGWREKQKIALRRRPLMIPVYRHNAIPQRVYAGFNGLAAAIRALAVKADYAQQSPLWNERQRHILFARLRACRLLRSKPDLAIRSSVVRDLDPIFL